MDLMQSADQDAIQETVRSFLSAELPMQRVREIADGAGAEPIAALWKKAGELGFFALALPAESGGAGFALSEEMVLFGEIGRALAPGPWLGSVIATRAAHAAGEEELAAKLRRGELPCALVVGEDGLSLQGGAARGVLPQVADAPVAGAMAVLSPERVSFIERRPQSWEIAARRSFDPTRPLHRVELREAPCRELVRGEAARRLWRQATVLACAEAVGGIERTVEMSVEYSCLRRQFGKPIGSFQAVKHRCADMAVRAEVARSATIYATIAVRDDLPDAEMQVAIANLMCARSYLENGADNIQNHGGMGFTWECDAHLYMKRAHSFDQLFGSRRAHLDCIVAAMR